MSNAETVAEAAARARHDLGKYIAFQARWVEPGAPVEALRDALREDLLRTRRGPDGVVDAATLWRGLREPLLSLGIAGIDARMETLAARAAALDTLDEATLLDTARLAREVADELRAAHARAKETSA
ncbi:MAG: hypothetical protein Q8P41_01035 [Pseudomonadota bacterium]|nr:hypothetical protein [Pseudomonadota bacterium]